MFDVRLSTALEYHAPVVKWTFTVSPDNPGDNEDIRCARKNVRRLRRWKVTRLTIEKQLKHIAKFCEKLSVTTGPLPDTLKWDVEWTWDRKHSQIIEEILEQIHEIALKEAPDLRLFDPHEPVT